MDRRRGISFLRVSAPAGASTNVGSPEPKSNGPSLAPSPLPMYGGGAAVAGSQQGLGNAGNSSRNFGDNSPNSTSYAAANGSNNSPGAVGSNQSPEAAGLNGSVQQLNISDFNRDNDPLTQYLGQLAAKQAKVVELKTEQSRIAAELKAAEADLQKFQESGRQLASMVGSPHRQGVNGQSLLSPGSEGGHGGDVLDMGRRVVDEIGNQFWSFVEDVRSATMGGNDADNYDWEDSEGREGRPRNLRPKESIQNIVETIRRKSQSPVRSRRSSPGPKSTRLNPSQSPRPSGQWDSNDSNGPTGEGSKRGQSRSPTRSRQRPPTRSPARSPARSAARSPTRSGDNALKSSVSRSSNREEEIDLQDESQDTPLPTLPQRPKFSEQLPPPA